MNNKTNRIILSVAVAMAVFFTVNTIGNSVFANSSNEQQQSIESNDDGNNGSGGQTTIIATINDSAPQNDTCTVSKKDCVVLDNTINGIADILKDFNSKYPGMK